MVYSARNTDQKLVGCFLKIGYNIFFRLLIAVPLKMYRKYGWSKWILVSQMLAMVRSGQWPTEISSIAKIDAHAQMHTD